MAPVRPSRPNTVMRALRGNLSPNEYAAAVRRAARETGEQVSCDARYIGRIESGEIRCPNYAYTRVFLHMYPSRSLTDLGFEPRKKVRGRSQPNQVDLSIDPTTAEMSMEEDPVQRRVFMLGGPAVVAGITLDPTVQTSGKVGMRQVRAVEHVVWDICVQDAQCGGDTLYKAAGQSLNAAYQLLNDGTYSTTIGNRLQSATGELAITVGWLAHDSARAGDARSLYTEALASSRMAGDQGLEAHVFCNMAFLARQSGQSREALRAAQAGQQAAKDLGSPRLLSLLAMREANGWAVLTDRSAAEQAMVRGHRLFDQGPADADPTWMRFFYNAAELACLEAQAWSALRKHERASAHAQQAVMLVNPQHFARNTALYTVELAWAELRRGELAGAATAATRVVEFLPRVRSTRIRRMLDTTAHALDPHTNVAEVADFIGRYREAVV